MSTAAIAGAGAGLAAQPAAARAASNGGRLSVAEFGVEPDSDLDQTEGFQRAIDQASQNGRTLMVPPGSYRVGALRLTGSLCIQGAAGRTNLHYTGAGAFVTVRDANDIFISGLTFNGGLKPLDDHAPQALLAASGCRNLQLEHCTFRASAGNGMALTACGGRISHCAISDVMKAGVLSVDAKGLEISGNTVHDCFNNGIQVWRSSQGEDGTLVTNNRIERIAAYDGGTGQNGNGVNIFRAGNVIVSQNRIADCAYSAVRSNAGSACQIVGNSCSRLGEVAIYAEFGFEGAIIASNVIESAAQGISITNFNEGGRLAVCANNIVRDLFVRRGEADVRGIGISAEADTAVEGNVVENAPVYGIALGWGRYLRDVTATGNVVRNCRIGIAVSASRGAGKALVASNMISGSKTAAIAGLELNDVVTADLTQSPARVPGNMAVQGNLVS